MLKEVRLNNVKNHKDDKENNQPKGKKKVDSQIIELKDEYMNLIQKYNKLIKLNENTINKGKKL